MNTQTRQTAPVTTTLMEMLDVVDRLTASDAETIAIVGRLLDAHRFWYEGDELPAELR